MAKGEIIRSEALKRLLDLNVSQHLRRAMLRKTVKTRVPELLDGQPCAYWRWNKKGAKKRGALTIARFLGPFIARKNGMASHGNYDSSGGGGATSSRLRI